MVRFTHGDGRRGVEAVMHTSGVVAMLGVDNKMNIFQHRTNAQPITI